MKPMNLPKPVQPSLILRDVAVFEGLLDTQEQQAMLADIRKVVSAAPLMRPVTRWGKPLSVRMSAAGQFGWTSDRRGYRYEPKAPSGADWPAIPTSVMAVWGKLSGCARQPECCLINYYDSDARMGLHQDCDEADFGCPVVSISLGDDAQFRIGHVSKGGTTQKLMLRSGDVLVMGGPSRLVYHGVDKIMPGNSTLLPKPGRINLTLRVVT